MDGKLLVEELLAYARAHLALEEQDVPYMRNRLLAALSLTAAAETAPAFPSVAALPVPDELIERLSAYAKEHALCEAGEESIFTTEVMGLLTPPPSAINRLFYEIYRERGERAALDWFYALCIHNDYVKKTAIGKNLEWVYPDGDTILEITVNLSKPEKSNKEIALLLAAPKTQEKYPACPLCRENEGYRGTLTHPARANLRTVSLRMGGEDWFFQYSPYGYYQEHAIAISAAHTPMKVDATTPRKLLDFVDAFPSYFMGSNAALPIVGGSILNHEHYQGGGALLPMQKAPAEVTYKIPHGGAVRLQRLLWYNSAVRLVSKDRGELEALAVRFIEAWREYSDPEVGIFSYTDGTPHNTLSPIARREKDTYVMELIFRNNRTDATYPDGIYHAHPEHHNIKKEGIGLIEAMGRFILPGRLKAQLAAIADILAGKALFTEEALADPSHPLSLHAAMIARLVGQYGTALSEEAAEAAVRLDVNRTCTAILENTAVFKRDEKGLAAFDRFIHSVIDK